MQDVKGVKDVKKHASKLRVLFTSLTIFTSCVVCAGVLAQTQKPPVFRARVDLMQLDVTVLDKDGRPVRGLTAADFILLEDNIPQTIQGFSAVDLADRVTGGPVWASRASSDVATNEIDNQRIFVIVIDDALGMGGSPPDLWAVREMKKSAALFIGSLGATDLAALVFTNKTRSSQNLTTDHARLVRAVEAYPEDGGGILMPMRGSSMDRCLGQKYSVGTVLGVVNNLAPIPDRRKSVVYFGGELPWASQPDRCSTYSRWREVFAAAQQAHVTINPIDTMGLRPGGVTGKAEQYLTVAANTGGRAIVASNDFEPGIRRIFLENSSYYLLAYHSTNAAEDGTFRRIALSVRDRSDLEVSTRRSYWAPKTRTTDDVPLPPPPEIEALSGILPLSNLNLRATAASFAVAGTDKSTVTVALGVRQPAFADRTPEQIELVVKAFTADGDQKGSETQTIPITVPAAPEGADTSRYEVLARIEVPKPGKYELRLSAHSVVTDTRGSVYVDVDVPDFRKERLSLSGVVLSNALPAAPVAPARALRDIVPLVPTTERTFRTSDIVTAFLRAYQGGNDKLAPVTLKIRILDAAGKSVFDRTEGLGAARFNAERAADYQLRLPVATLTAGDYLVTFEAASGKVTVRRHIRFQVR